jgi:hypothetical protein
LDYNGTKYDPWHYREVVADFRIVLLLSHCGLWNRQLSLQLCSLPLKAFTKAVSAVLRPTTLLGHLKDVHRYRTLGKNIVLLYLHSWYPESKNSLPINCDLSKDSKIE